MKFRRTGLKLRIDLCTGIGLTARVLIGFIECVPACSELGRFVPIHNLKETVSQFWRVLEKIKVCYTASNHDRHTGLLAAEFCKLRM